MPAKSLPVPKPRRPPPASPAPGAPRAEPRAAEAFVRKGDALPGTRPMATPSNTGVYARRGDGTLLKRQTVYLPEDLARALKARCAQDGGDLSTVITGLVRGYLGRT